MSVYLLQNTLVRKEIFIHIDSEQWILNSGMQYG